MYQNSSLLFKNLINSEKNLIFFIGAGCSIDPPSCLPAGWAMIESILKFCCIETEVKRILELKKLRFESIIELFQDHVDRDLKIIEFYNQCDKPNLQHFFIAEMIKKGHIVITTNFDNLIETALLKSGVSKNDIIPVITQEDYKKFSNPIKLLKDEKKVLYKIHGSYENIITRENTKESMITTIRSIGKNKEGLNLFQLEPFKRDLFNNVPENSKLIIMGYSGSDDFDIIPTFKIWKKIKNLIWINHTINNIEKPYFTQIKNFNYKFYPSNQIDKVLLEIYKTGNIKKVFKFNINTTFLIKNLISSKPSLDKDNFLLKPDIWLKENLNNPDNLLKNFIPSIIYKNYNKYDDSLRCSKQILTIAESEGNKNWISKSLNNIGFIYEIRGNLNIALENYNEALKIDEQVHNLRGKQSHLNNIGSLYAKQGYYQKSIILYRQALNISIKLKDKYLEAIYLSNIGMVYKELANYPVALDFIKKSLEIRKVFGDLMGMAKSLTNLGVIYNLQGFYPKALKLYEEAFKIFENLGDLSNQSATLRCMGQIYYSMGNYSKSLENYNKSIKINKELKDLAHIGLDSNEIGTIYFQKKDYGKAMKYFQESLKISLQLNHRVQIACAYNNIASIYKDLRDYEKALIYVQKSLFIDKKLGNLREVAIKYNNIGFLYEIQGNHEFALEYYHRALNLNNKIGDIIGIARDKNNIGLLLKRIGRKNEALNQLIESLKILKENNLNQTVLAKKIEENINLISKEHDY